MTEITGKAGALPHTCQDDERRSGANLEFCVHVILPAHLQTLARAGAEVSVQVAGSVTQRSVLDALEARYPALAGTTRDRATGRRRAFIRFFACEEDLSNQPPDDELPAAVAAGREPFLIVGAIAGG